MFSIERLINRMETTEKFLFEKGDKLFAMESKVILDNQLQIMLVLVALATKIRVED